VEISDALKKKPIEEGKSETITVLLHSHTQWPINASTVPETILWKLVDERSNELLSGKFHLESNLFIGNLIREFDELEIDDWINFLILGPVGSGKSTFIRSIFTCLSTEPGKCLVGMIGNGKTQTTLGVIHRILSDHITEKWSNRVRIRLTDTIGIDSTTYKDNYIHDLVKGHMVDGATPLQKLINHTHVPIIVVPRSLCEFINLPDDVSIKHYKNVIAELNGYGFSPMVVVTRFEEIQTELEKQMVLSTLPGLLGINDTAFPLSSYPSNSKRVFETDMQALDILYEALSRAKSWLNKQSEKLNPEYSNVD